MTAVEWFFNELQRMQYFIGNDMLQALEQAKEMEKKQIIDAYRIGECEVGLMIINKPEQYYNETYDKKNR